jgi:hypothetical protein
MVTGIDFGVVQIDQQCGINFSEKNPPMVNGNGKKSVLCRL